jgi:hypothetical protein
MGFTSVPLVVLETTLVFAFNTNRKSETYPIRKCRRNSRMDGREVIAVPRTVSNTVSSNGTPALRQSDLSPPLRVDGGGRSREGQCSQNKADREVHDEY